MNLKAMAVVASGVVASIASGDAIQWRVQDGGNGHWYGAVEAGTWAEAMRSAQAGGGSLATLTTQEENEFVRIILQATGRTRGYIGLEQADGQPAPEVGWHWVTGEPLAWTNWLCFGGRLGCAPDDSPCALPPLRVEDDQANCACIEQTGLWDDLEKTIWCDAGWTSRVALIEWSADCNNDGIVDYGQCHDGTLPDYNSNNVPDCCEQGMACAVADYPMQWRTEDGGNGHWYSKSIWTSPMNWNDARASATARGADLVAISAAAENTWIVTRFDLSHDPCAGYRGWFIGAYQDLLASDYSEPNGGWRWSNGESWGWTNWRPGAPDNHLGNQHWALIDTPIEGQAWDDVAGGPGGPEPICRAIFEWSADCNSDGVVDFGQILGGELADVDGNGVPDDCECVADLDGDGVVASEDLAAVLNNWGTKGGVIDADVNNDGIVDGSDLSIVLNGWGACP